MNAGAGGFSGGVKAAQAGAAGQIGPDAAHQVMGRGANGNEVAGQVEAVLGEEGADAGKTLVKVDACDVAHVEIDGARFAGSAPCLRGRWRGPPRRAGRVRAGGGSAP